MICPNFPDQLYMSRSSYLNMEKGYRYGRYTNIWQREGLRLHSSSRPASLFMTPAATVLKKRFTRRYENLPRQNSCTSMKCSTMAKKRSAAGKAGQWGVCFRSWQRRHHPVSDDRAHVDRAGRSDPFSLQSSAGLQVKKDK
jgi:hypothetical protein